MAKTNLTAERLRECLDYDPDTGIFRWKEKRNGLHIGDIAGGVMKIGYITICVDGLQTTAHRLAWLHVYGEWPNGSVDHIDRNQTNNRITNLRVVDKSTNALNMVKAKSDSVTGFLGVSVDRSGPRLRYAATLTVNKKRVFYRMFKTPESARDAYLEAKARFAPTPVCK